MKKTLLIFCFAVALAIPKNLFAWGMEGHAIISEIAFRLLDDSTKARVVRALNGLTIEQAGIWMDDMRSNPTYDYMKPWHYINIEKNAAYDARSDNNIIWELESVIAFLQNKKQLTDNVTTQLYILFHLLGDLHQPLHVGYSVDRGGNTISLTFQNQSTNLHRLWDTQIIQSQNITLDNCMDLYKTLSIEDVNKIKRVEIVQWMTESRILLPSVYDFSNSGVNESYMNTNGLIIKQQLVYAGIRLASLLNNLFS